MPNQTTAVPRVDFDFFRNVPLFGLFSYYDRIQMKVSPSEAYCFRKGDTYVYSPGTSVEVYLPPDQPDSILLHRLGAAPRFAHVDCSVMRGAENICTARSGSMAERIANALNRYRPGKRGS